MTSSASRSCGMLFLLGTYAAQISSADTVPLTIQASLKEAVANTSYSAVLNASGGVQPYTWKLSNSTLPSGLVLSPGGIVSGIPQRSGLFSFTVTVTDAAGASATAPLTLAIASYPLAVYNTTLPVATIGVDYYVSIPAGGGFGQLTYLITTGALPPGLILRSFGQIAGTPTTTGFYAFTLQVADEWGASITLALEIVVRSTYTPYPSLYSIRNSASYSSNIAPGSMVVLFGYSLGPDTLVQSSSFPLPLTLGGTSVKVTSGTIVLDCPMIYASSTQVAAIVPSKTPAPPPGTGLLFSVTYNYATGGESSYYSSTTWKPSAAGLYTLDSSGAGPGIFTTESGTVKTFTNTAHPGEIITTWATGLGPTTGDDSQPPPVSNIPDIEVYVGTQSARVLYAGRSPCCSGLDQISFEVPAVNDSCFVPVAIRGAGVISNFVTLPVSRQGSTCGDAGPAIPPSIYSRAAAGESLRIAALAVGPQGILARGGFPQANHVAALLSSALHTHVSTEDAERLLRAIQSKNKGAIRRAMWKYRRQWNALDTATRNSFLDKVDDTENGAAASFFTLNSSGTLLSEIASGIPTQGNCVITGPIPVRLSASSRALDAGALTLIGPMGQFSMTSSLTGRYSALFGPAYHGPAVPPGSYTVAAAAFSTRLDVSTPIGWANAPSADTPIDTAQPLQFTWTGGTPGATVLLGGSQGGRETFLCSEDAAKGTFTVPALFLSQMNKEKQATFFIGHHPLERPVSIPGYDYAVFADASNDARALPLK